MKIVTVGKILDSQTQLQSNANICKNKCRGGWATPRGSNNILQNIYANSKNNNDYSISRPLAIVPATHNFFLIPEISTKYMDKPMHKSFSLYGLRGFDIHTPYRPRGQIRDLQVAMET